MRSIIIALGMGLLTVSAAACQSDEAALVGSWQLVDPDTGTVTNTLTFDADGQFTMVEVEDESRTTTGTYEADGVDLTMHGTDDQGVTYDFDATYYLGDGGFMLGALLPQGDVAGVVGTWQGHVSSVSDDPNDTDLDEADTYTFEEGGAVTVHAVTPDKTEDLSGTWTDDGAGEITATFQQDNFTIGIHMQLVDGAALGGATYQRADTAARVPARASADRSRPQAMPSQGDMRGAEVPRGRARGPRSSAVAARFLVLDLLR